MTLRFPRCAACIRRGAIVCFLSLPACSATERTNSDVDASAKADTQLDIAKEADTNPVTCCPLGAGPCGCPFIGGSPPCRRVCDVGKFETRIDKNGCPYLEPVPGASCLGPPPAKTTGKACSSDVDCDPGGDGAASCSRTMFAEGTVEPTPVCFGLACAPPSDSTARLCDDGAGVCVYDGGDNICHPRCTFDDSGGPPVGCLGKNACSPFRSGLDLTTGKLKGDGICFGGCLSDADCTDGNKCQLERAVCVKSLTSYTKAIGDACTKSDVKACNCLFAPSMGSGYCTQRCRVGIDACPSGFTCDAQLPSSVFTKSPKGILGWCLKDCTLDTECEALSATCLESGGIGRKTCQTGPPM